MSLTFKHRNLNLSRKEAEELKETHAHGRRGTVMDDPFGEDPLDSRQRKSHFGDDVFQPRKSMAARQSVVRGERRSMTWTNRGSILRGQTEALSDDEDTYNHTKMQRKIHELEAEVEEAKGASSHYMMQIRDLREEVEQLPELIRTNQEQKKKIEALEIEERNQRMLEKQKSLEVAKDHENIFALKEEIDKQHRVIN